MRACSRRQRIDAAWAVVTLVTAVSRSSRLLALSVLAHTTRNRFSFDNALARSAILRYPSIGERGA